MILRDRSLAKTGDICSLFFQKRGAVIRHLADSFSRRTHEMLRAVFSNSRRAKVDPGLRIHANENSIC
jgi:hypothetical protein